MNARGLVVGVCLGALALGSVAGCGEETKSSPTPTETIGAAPTLPDGSVVTAPATGATAGGAPTSLGATETAATPAASGTTAAAGGAPVMPAAAKQNTKAGAEAFAKWYFAVLEYLSKSGIGSHPNVARATCKTCKENAERIELYRTEGLHATGDRLQITEVNSFTAGGDWFVTLETNEMPISLVDKNGNIDSTAPAGVGAQQVQLHRIASGWEIVEIRGRVGKR